METLIIISVTCTMPDGHVDTRTEQYFPADNQGTYWSVYETPMPNGTVRRSTGMGYSGYADEAAFRAERESKLREQCVTAYKHREEARARAATVARFDALVPLWAPVLDGLQEKDAIIAALRTACAWHGALTTLETLVQTEKGKLLRATLRNAFKAAREEAREQYPEEYREAEEKSDFYEDHDDDTGQYISWHL